MSICCFKYLYVFTNLFFRNFINSIFDRFFFSMQCLSFGARNQYLIQHPKILTHVSKEAMYTDIAQGNSK